MTDRDHLLELAVSDLGIIERAQLVLAPGTTALTGETGAGKTLLVGAIELLLGARADPSVVRAGAREAIVEGRFVVGGEELVLTRVVPAEGRSRAYIDGRMATATALGEVAGGLIDLHGQHDHQSLLSAAVQRDALDRFGGVDLARLHAVRAELRDVRERLAELGGDAGARARELDLLQFQIAELHDAGLTDADEDRTLDELEDRLSSVVAHREAVATAVDALTHDGGAIDAVGSAIAALDGHRPFESLVERARSSQADLSDLATELRAAGDSIEDDPARLAAVRERRHLLVDLRRKYGTAAHPDGRVGDGTLAAVLDYLEAIEARRTSLDRHGEVAAGLEAERAALERREAEAAAEVGRARRKAAAPLARAVEGHLGDLAMASAAFAVEVERADPGDRVEFLLGANRGAPLGPLTKVASGGELARTMLALRLVLSDAPGVLVFDEVDAGIGGSAALAVGRALAELGRDHQVLVVTHLPQVAAHADVQISVQKAEADGRTVATAIGVDGDDRVIELARMLSGTPESPKVHDAARELLRRADEARRP